jgi:ATP-dependent RNA helicase DeaD
LADPAPTPAKTFKDLGLSKSMLAALKEAGYETPTAIQAGLIPLALDCVDVVGQARTGTGKTASFAIPILEVIEAPFHPHCPQALVLVPTRELAVQVRDEFVKLAHGQRINCVALYGGKPLKGQLDKLKRGAPVIIGTPGRVLDHLSRGSLDMSDLEIVVLDEADRMLDIGFRPDIERILKKCPSDRQTLLLSATVPPVIEKLAKRYMIEPEFLNFSPKDISVDTIDQYYFTVDQERKFDLLVRLIEREQPKQAIVFCRTKRGTDKICDRLSKKFKSVATIHGDMSQGARDRVMRDFREQNVTVLVATDVIGRGIDVSSVSHIINYDIPAFCDDYVHRVGRTGRMGREGVAYSFVTPEEGYELTRIEERINRLLKRATMADFELVSTRAKAKTPGVNPTTGEPEETPPERKPPEGLGRRPGKRYRRAL